MIYAKAENWPDLCCYDQDKMCKISRLFEIVNMRVLACKICPKKYICGPRTQFGPALLNYSWSDSSETTFNPDKSW